jgi:hypothetical protein
MEGIVINHQKRKFHGKNIPNGYVLDHIVPYCLTMDNSDINLQIIKKEDHNKKTAIDLKIIKEFRKKGWIEKITNYSHELKMPMEFLKEEYIKKFKDLQDLQVLQVYILVAYMGKLCMDYCKTCKTCKSFV